MFSFRIGVLFTVYELSLLLKIFKAPQNQSDASVGGSPAKASVV